MRKIVYTFHVCIVAVAVLFNAAIVFRYPLKFRGAIDAACAEFGVSRRLVASVIWTESKFRPQATSRKGAAGLMQLMPATAEYLCARLGVPYDGARLYEPSYNIRLGAYYLGELLSRYDETYALAAYNAGETKAKEWMASGVIDYPETRDYVERVGRAKKAYAYYGVSDASS